MQNAKHTNWLIITGATGVILCGWCNYTKKQTKAFKALKSAKIKSK